MHRFARAYYFLMPPPPDCTPLPILRPDQDPTVENDCAKDQAARKLYDDTSPATAEVYAGGKLGSGFFVGDGTRFITNAHVVNGTYSLISLHAKTGEYYRARIEKLDDINDLAVLRLDGDSKHKTALQIGPSGNLKSGDPVYALGHPSGRQSTFISPGKFQQFTTLGDGLDPQHNKVGPALDRFRFQASPQAVADAQRYFESPRLESNVRAERGNSGGPLVDSSERAVGVVANGASADRPNVTWAVPSEKVSQLLDPTNNKFTFQYGDVSSLRAHPIGTAVVTLGTSAVALAFPRFGAGAISAGSLLNTPEDIDHFLHPKQTYDQLYYGLSLASTLSLTTGTALAFLKSRRAAYTAIGTGLLAAAGQTLVPHVPRLLDIKRNDGTDPNRKPFYWNGEEVQ